MVDDLLHLPSDFRLCKVGGVDWDDLDPGCDLERGGASASPSFSHAERNFRNPIRFLGWTQEAGDTITWLTARAAPALSRGHVFWKVQLLGLRPIEK